MTLPTYLNIFIWITSLLRRVNTQLAALRRKAGTATALLDLDHRAGDDTAGVRKPFQTHALIQGEIWWEPTSKRQLNKALRKEPENICFCTGRTNFSCCEAINMHLLGKSWCLKQAEWLLNKLAPRRRLSNWAPKSCTYMHVFGCAFKFSILAPLQISQNLKVSTKRERFKK